MEGLHLTADLHGCRCDPALLTDRARLADLCASLTIGAGLTIVAQRWHKFPDHAGSPGGVTGMLLLAESHLAVHTWPEVGGVTLDVYVCNFTGDNSGKARELMSALEHAFQPGRSRRQQLRRGRPDAAAGDPDEVVLEALNGESVYGFRFQRRLLFTRTPYQRLELLESSQLGRTLRLDGRFMTSEADEFFYHEALVHPVALVHPFPERALILGGGDGGAAEELLKHGSVRHVTLVELDAEVIGVARRELASIHRGALDDPRVQILCEDGDRFVNETEETFDLVFLDLTDPETPAGPMYTQNFMGRLKHILAPGGAVVLHLGAPFFEGEQVRSLLRSLRRTFRIVSPYGLHIPLYGAYWGMAVASDDLDTLSLSPFELAERLRRRAITDLRYYNPQVHDGLFALPNFYRALFADEPAVTRMNHSED
ncbi:polyamine aminopropyltransferase [Ramlibacter henchirensis]|uniref:Polyamine aminopropyltransferase n=1 Tax=Ramlibacter henchirensis TaxID=204072 RepID=A0A4Z0C5S7_9BURK|nr:polyamine aminopropyltransferase [Ramlibacter henchirensis]TFZ05698.1 polyamine aminopropyltransferase [Ramlibacter henchirensis]